ncbi:uncharacterized protein LOC118557541 [Fundulus heteroclitus]|uniref:uncharacterized protein LOC118557541 n=1 Tax=Fundulus heteroclitus TaxID=8078 RepID=UPI00165B3A10|nr:uncharacterized protein LOC118557541 [Fundulus heteroclitus]
MHLSPGQVHGNMCKGGCLQCKGDRSVFCRMDALHRYCSLPDYWRLCCKTCSNINDSTVEPNSPATATLNSTVPPTPSKSLFSSILTTAQPTKAASKVKETKTNPKLKKLHFNTPPTPYEEDFSTIPVTAPSFPSSGSKVSPTNVSGDAVVTARTPLVHYGSTDIETTTPGSFNEFITPSDDVNAEAVTGTTAFSETTVTSSGEATSRSEDDIKESYSSPGRVTDTVVLEDGPSMVIPTIKGEDTTEPASPPWLDLPEHIPVGFTGPPTTAVSHTVSPEIISKPRQNAAENDANSLDGLDNRVVGADSDISKNNLIPKLWVSLRERTKNKRIQELLEEKRNFLLRMKRGHTEH